MRLRLVPLAAYAALSACVVVLSGCATSVVSVAPGHAAVVLAPDGALTRLDEGDADVSSAAQVDDFDLREQIQSGSFTALSADGVPLFVGDPVVSVHLVAGELAALDRELGPDGWRPLVAAVVQSTIARVLAGYRWDALDTVNIRAAQASITEQARALLAPRHLALSSVELKGITPRLPGLARAVTATSVWQERAAAAATRVEVARDRADSLRARAAGIAAANRAIAPTLDAGVLAAKRDAAWAALAASPRTVVRVSTDSQPAVEVTP